MYTVDERAVADAIVLRARLRSLVGEPSFRSDRHGTQIRSFRRDRGARSFRLSMSAPPRRIHH
jgi:hypothetical protein